MYVAKALLTVLLCVFCLTGCGVWRPLPTHGGGKRMDEEQRIVAGAIRTALEQVNVKELEGKNVFLEITALSHDGGGQVITPGINFVSGRFDDSSYTYPVPGSRDYDKTGWDVNVNYNLKPNLRPTVFRSQSDMDYFTSSLIMKLRLSDVSISAKSGNVILYVLMDILGTNLSSDDFVLLWSEKLKATCEFTYFAVEDNKLLFNPRSVGATATYTENNSLLYINNGNSFEMKATKPTGFPNYCPADISEDIGTLGVEPALAADGANNTEQKLRLADSYISARKFDSAQSLINDVLKSNPEHPGVDAVMARLQSELNQSQDTAETIKDAVRIKTD